MTNWLVWSNEHSAWWRPNQCGYTTDVAQAGRYSEAEARECCDSRSPRVDKLPPEVMVREDEVCPANEDEMPSEIARLRTALQQIASYDKDSTHGEGICPYGCDCPQIAREALKT